MIQPLVISADVTAFYVVRLPFGCDLLEALTAICNERDIRLGRISGIGAVRRANIAYYDQRARQYLSLSIDEPHEIVSLTGNISLKEGAPFVHAHVVLANKNGEAIGGHLNSGTEVFACECVIEAFRGPSLERRYDEQTGLSLWTPSCDK